MVLFIIIIISMLLQNINPARNYHNKISNNQNEHESGSTVLHVLEMSLV